MAFDEETDESDPDGYTVWERRELVSRDRRAATWLGALGGAFGGAAMLLVARAMMLHTGGLSDPAIALGDHVPLQSSVPPQIVGLAIAVIAGTLLGALLGRSTWRVTRVAPRILFFSILLPAVWLCAQVVIVGRMSAASAMSVPFVPFLVGSLAFALFVAIFPAVRRARVVEILPEKK
jgi:hypothetical protein